MFSSSLFSPTAPSRILLPSLLSRATLLLNFFAFLVRSPLPFTLFPEPPSLLDFFLPDFSFLHFSEKRRQLTATRPRQPVAF